MKKKIAIGAVLILAAAAVFFGPALLRICPPWLWGDYPLACQDLGPLAWSDSPVTQPASADQVYVLLSNGSGELSQSENHFRSQVEDMLNSYRYQAAEPPQDVPPPDDPGWRGGDEVVFLDGDTQCRLCFDVVLWVPTQQGWQCYLPHNPDRFRQDLLEFQTEYHNDASLYSYPESGLS